MATRGMVDMLWQRVTKPGHWVLGAGSNGAVESG